MSQNTETVNEGGLYVEPLLTRPKTVAIVALGRSSQEYVHEMMSVIRSGPDKVPYDEVWTVNRGLRSFAHDKLWVMDDFRWIEKKSPGYAEFLKRHDKPVFTSTVYPEYPTAVEFPYQQAVEFFEDDLFNANTISYMAAYAIMIGVKQLHLYGCDFFYPNGSTAESGGQALAYLLGWARAKFGLMHIIPNTSTLLYAHKIAQTPAGISRVAYGYHRKDELKREEARNAPNA